MWNRPDVLPLDAYLDRTWGEWLGRWADESAPTLLDAPQEQMLWEQIIRESPDGASLLQIPETARQAVETWRLIEEYRLPVDGSFEASPDWSAFASWSREFQRRCRLNRWLERARLPDFVRKKIAAGEVSRPSAVLVAGFDEMTLQQAEFLAALGEWQAVELPSYLEAPERKKLPDSAGEIRAAAVAARRLLEADPTTQIGITVAPDLTRLRPKIDRIFGEVLEGAFHLSVGPSLAEYPVVRAALLMLEFASGKLPLPRAGMLLRSPFLGGSDKEWGRRAQLDAKLRKNGLWEMSVPRLLEESGSCPELQRALRRVEKRFESTRKNSRRATGAVASRICSKHSAGRAIALPAVANFKP